MNGIKYSFLFPYKNRVEQLHNTLISLGYWYGRRNDWEVLVVLDGQNEPISIPNCKERVRQIAVSRDGVNPAPLFNLAAKESRGEILVISNPECYHVSNVLGWFDEVLAADPSGYAVAACDNVKHIGTIWQYKDSLGEKIQTFQHSTEHNVLYHYCSAMLRETWERLGGFDERFGAGYACEDDDFRDRVVCGGIPCYTNDSIRVLHQEHEKYKHTPEIRQRYNHNLALLRAGEAARGYRHNVNDFKVKR